MKKITLLIIIIIVFNFICLSFFQPKVYASDSSMSIDDFKQLDEGKANIHGNETTINVSDSDIGSVGSKFATVLTALSTIGVKLISSVVEQGGCYHIDSDYSTDNVGIFTINSLVFGEYYLFSSKPYETLSDSNEENSSF